MEETKWLTKGKIIIIIALLLVVGGVVSFIFIHRNNLKKEYIKFQNQLEYAAPNYLLKEKITLMEDEWREISIKDIMSQKLVINKRASDCDGYVIAEANKNIESDEQKNEDSNNEIINEKDKVTDNDNKNSTVISEDKEDKKEEAEKNISNNISYRAYISCKKIYKTNDYGKKPTDKNKNDKKPQTKKDTEKPILELFGDAEIKITEGGKYEELGAIATDNIDGDITSKIKITGKVDTSKTGKYVIKYTVIDSSNNKTTLNRTVIVEKKPVEDPSSKPNEEIPNTEKPNEETPNTQKPSTPQTPSEPIVDTTSPVIIFNDNSLYQTICQGSKANISPNGIYGYIARDNVDGNITSRVKITGDTGIISTPGVYNLYYEVSDNAGNKATASKKFTVNSCTSTIPESSKKINVTGLRVSPNTVTLSIGDSTRIDTTIYPSNATDKSLIYKSSNTNIATVTNDGTIVAKAPGRTVITVSSSNGISTRCNVQVIAK